MKSVWLGLGLVIVLGGVAWWGTGEFATTSAADRYTSPNGTVRLDGAE